MADVQLENGYTKIANEILERLALTKLSPTQFRIILAILRYTYGFNRKDHEISLSFLSETTGIHRQRIKPDLDKLIEWNIVKVTEEGDFTKPRKLAFNKDYDTWCLQSSKMLTVSKNADSTVSEIADSTVSKNADTGVSKSAYQEINNINKNLNKKDKEIAADKNTHEEQTGGVPTTESVQLLNSESVGQIPGSSSSDYERIKNTFMQLAGIRGFEISPLDQQAILELLEYKIEIEKVLKWLKECFDRYKPKHKHDKINSFRYCLPYILDRYFEEQEAKNPKKATYRKKPTRVEPVPSWLHNWEINEPAEIEISNFEEEKRKLEAELKQFGS
ncbi:replication protein [Caldibacillus debilis]|uniref:replication protein n=1 Tax=Caldibacillus debilis TaxID=301148 RepID=UPI0016032AC4|nr:replication protein [Caldibacillus debilis]